ncbi:hypothetical protein C8F01DRAFT_376766 [Mycena amicta]|nr:hypothetical protein C8F01DRAFT_376766 [Mycena amicta]
MNGYSFTTSNLQSLGYKPRVFLDASPTSTNAGASSSAPVGIASAYSNGNAFVRGTAMPLYSTNGQSLLPSGRKVSERLLAQSLAPGVENIPPIQDFLQAMPNELDIPPSVLSSGRKVSEQRLAPSLAPQVEDIIEDFLLRPSERSNTAFPTAIGRLQMNQDTAVGSPDNAAVVESSMDEMRKKTTPLDVPSVNIDETIASVFDTESSKDEFEESASQYEADDEDASAQEVWDDTVADSDTDYEDVPVIYGHAVPILTVLMPFSQAQQEKAYEIEAGIRRNGWWPTAEEMLQMLWNVGKNSAVSQEADSAPANVDRTLAKVSGAASKRLSAPAGTLSVPAFLEAGDVFSSSHATHRRCRSVDLPSKVVMDSVPSTLAHAVVQSSEEESDDECVYDEADAFSETDISLEYIEKPVGYTRRASISSSSYTTTSSSRVPSLSSPNTSIPTRSPLLSSPSVTVGGGANVWSHLVVEDD